MNRRTLLPRLLLVPLLLLGQAPAAHGGPQAEPREPSEESQPIFSEILEVRVVNLEVVVEDRQGNRVPGLGREDFRLRVDGEEVPLDYFSEIREGRAATKPSETGTGIPGVLPGRPVGTSYLVFIDDYFSVAPERDRVLRGLGDEVARLGPEDRMAVVAFDGKRLEMLSTWSRSATDLRHVLEEARSRPTWGLRTRSFLRHAEQAGSIGGFDVIEDLEQEVENVSLAVTATLRSFASPPGRKVMLLLAGGWPYSTTRFVTSSETVWDPRAGRFLAPIHQTANLLGYTLYPIDLRGIRPAVDIVSTNARPRTTAPREEEEHDTLRILAQETGGQALLDSARLTALERVMEDTRSYYWLGFTPTWRGDNRGHEIDLEVLRPGLRVRTRKGYRDFSRSQEVSYMVESALLFGALPGSQTLHVEMGEAKRVSGKRMLPLRLTFPLDGITVLRQGSRYVAHLELRIAAVDERGGRSGVDLQSVVLSGSRPPVPGQQGVQTVDVHLRRKKHDLVVSLHDPLSGIILTSVVEVGR